MVNGSLTSLGRYCDRDISSNYIKIEGASKIAEAITMNKVLSNLSLLIIQI